MPTPLIRFAADALEGALLIYFTSRLSSPRFWCWTGVGIAGSSTGCCADAMTPQGDERCDRFFTTPRDRGGTGHGLAIAQRRVRAFGGDITMGEAERGAAFRIRLKAA